MEPAPPHSITDRADAKDGSDAAQTWAAYAKLVRIPRVILTGFGGLQQQSEIDHEKSLRFQGVWNHQNGAISPVCQPSRTKIHPQILLTRQKACIFSGESSWYVCVPQSPAPLKRSRVIFRRKAGTLVPYPLGIDSCLEWLIFRHRSASTTLTKGKCL